MVIGRESNRKRTRRQNPLTSTGIPSTEAFVPIERLTVITAEDCDDIRAPNVVNREKTARMPDIS